jgi:uncharacterized membrane protein YuzA (DUF378 family)
MEVNMRTLNGIDWIALVILLLGGLNWGLVGFFDYNLVAAIFGNADRYVYAIVGLATIYVAVISPSFVHRGHPKVHGSVHQPI